MIQKIHPIAGTVAFATIITFMTSTLVAEAVGVPTGIAVVKQAILWGFLVLIPAMIVAGVTGTRLARAQHSVVLARKRRRMVAIALNGLFVLVPCAWILSGLASQGRFDTPFVVLQAIELMAGATNLFLMTRNIVDGRRLAGRTSPQN